MPGQGKDLVLIQGGRVIRRGSGSSSQRTGLLGDGASRLDFI